MFTTENGAMTPPNDQVPASDQAGTPADTVALDPLRRAEAAAALAEADGIDGWAERFALLGDPNRLRLLFCLHRAPGICVSDLADALGMSDTAVSHALRLLRGRGWVRSRRDGKMILYYLADETVHALLHEVGATHGSLARPAAD